MRPRRRVPLYVLVVVAILALEGVARLVPEEARPALSEIAFGQADLAEMYEADPELFWRLKPGLDGTFSGNRVRTSSLGLRGPEPVDPAVICLGDSVTFGYLVEEEAAFPSLLAGRLGVEMLAAGVPGYSSHQGLKLLERLLVRFRPRVVVISFGYNDARLFLFPDHAAAAGKRSRLAGLLSRSALVRRLAGWVGGGRVRRAR